jgi:hypothetical protein
LDFLFHYSKRNFRGATAIGPRLILSGQKKDAANGRRLRGAKAHRREPNLATRKNLADFLVSLAN